MSKFIELFERLVIAQETIAANLELQTQFAIARSKTAERVSRHNAKKKGVNLTPQPPTEKNEESKREELLPTPLIGERKKEERKDSPQRAREANSVPSADSAATAATSAAKKKPKTQIREERTKELQPKFDEFWAAYPKGRKHDKQKCLSRFVSWFLAKDVNEDELFAKMMNGLEAWKKTRDWLEDDGEFVCAPLVWLNNARWESDVQPWTPRTDKPVVAHNFRRVVRADNAQIMNEEQAKQFDKELNDAVRCM